VRTTIPAVLALLLASVVGFLVYASMVYTAEPAALAEVTSNTRITVTETHDTVTLTPAAGATGDGIVFFAGAKVDPAAYAPTFTELVEAGVTVVIVRPILGFAIMEFRPLATFTAAAPGVTNWMVGGHSLGGVRACQYAADASTNPDPDPAITGVILFGSYCATDISEADVPVLSLAGSADGLSTPNKIADAASLVPADATFVEIEGANHASFGAYGAQRGDGVATATDESVRSAISAAILGFEISTVSG
jgi:hypothetical protein